MKGSIYLMALLASFPAAAQHMAGETFSDAPSLGGRGPEMVVIPAGQFRMGCVSGQECPDRQLPVHDVAISDAFAISKYEVKIKQLDACVAGSGCRPRDQGMHYGTRPVTAVAARTIVSKQYYPGSLGPGVSDKDCILHGIHDTDRRFGISSDLGNKGNCGPYADSLGSIREMLLGRLNIFTYNGDNRHPPRSPAEYRAIQATGIVTCGTGGQGKLGSGFVISTGDGNSIVLTAGHIIRSPEDNTRRAPCQYEPYGQSPWRVKAIRAPKIAGLEKLSDEYVRNDWGMLLLDGELPQTMPLTQKGKEEIFQLLDSGPEARLKLYSRHPNPPQSWRPQIQISDNCELLRPRGRRDLLESPHILYHTCDSTSGSSGGLLALELADGTTEAIGLHTSVPRKRGYRPSPDERNDAIPRSDRVSGVALSLASDGSMPNELRRNLP